jgi:hypothetical protein
MPLLSWASGASLMGSMISRESKQFFAGSCEIQTIRPETVGDKEFTSEQADARGRDISKRWDCRRRYKSLILKSNQIQNGYRERFYCGDELKGNR